MRGNRRRDIEPPVVAHLKQASADALDPNTDPPPWCICRPGEGLESRALLTRFTPARLVEEELTDLDRLGVLRGPTWRRIPLMEIQRAARSIR